MPFNRVDHSLIGEIRPRFRLHCKRSVEECIALVDRRISEDDSITGTRAKNLIFMRIPAKEAHYWSPELTVRIEPCSERGDTIVKCLVGPRQSVWAMFTFIYGAIAVFTLFAGMYAWTLYDMGHASNWGWAVPIGIFVWGSIFTTSKIGQKRGRDQMLHLISTLYHSLDPDVSGIVERVDRC